MVIDELEDVMASTVVPVTILGSDIIHAFVIKKSGSKLSEEMIAEHVNSRVSDYKKLRGGAYFVDKIPLTASGKVMRYELKVMAQKIYEEKNK